MRLLILVSVYQGLIAAYLLRRAWQEEGRRYWRSPFFGSGLSILIVIALVWLLD